MNLGQLRAAVYERLGVPTTDAFYTSAVMLSLINQALHFNETEYPWPWLEKTATIATINGTSAYATPTGYRSTIAVVDANGMELDHVPAKTVHMLLGASGAPKMYDVLGGNVRLVPVATGAQNYTHIYIGGEVDLAADSDTPLLPSIFHPAIVEYAAYIAFRRMPGKQGDAGAALAAYQGWLEQMKVEAVRYSADMGGGLLDPARAPVAPPAK